MLIRFWCDSDITFSHGLHKNLVTELYFSIINVLCGAGGDATFAPQANLVFSNILSPAYIYPCSYVDRIIPFRDSNISFRDPR